MNVMQDLNSISVRDAMTTVAITVSATQKLSEVAKLFSDNMINSAPVVDDNGKCVGIMTSSDLVRFQSELPEISARIDHGMTFDIEQSDPEGPLALVPHPFDEVQRQMTRFVQSIDETESLHMAARIMCAQHIHHLIVLDDAQRPVGVLSSLDILAKLTG